MSLKRNLVKNPNAAENLNHWTITENGGDGWTVEDLPGGCGKNFPLSTITKYFVTSFASCKKSQLINLRENGYSDDILDNYQPTITVTDWYAAREDCGCQYELKIELLSQDKKVIQAFSSPPVVIPKGKGTQWQHITHHFSNYGPGVRYINVTHGGKDTQGWKGWYGVRVTNTSISVDI